ncbi:hypothetical protein [Paenibacillus hubeiensis]|uniref:hypothetical protein n=1 Tax=Paenibacillus hubeiensis TaxID=3077330 RepID=UPI0031BB2C32
MKKQKVWVTIPVTTAVLLALAGCGGQDTKPAEANSSSSAAAGQQTSESSANPSVSSDSGAKDAASTNTTDTAGTVVSSGSANTGKGESASAGQSGGNASSSSESSQSKVIKEVRSQLKLNGTLLPTSFPLDKGKTLAASIDSNTSNAFQVTFYAVDQPVALNDSSLTKSGSKAAVIATFEVNTYKDPNSTDIFPDEETGNVPDDMKVDLGHSIQGVAEGAAGSQYLTWNEGRWTLRIQSISEDQMNNPGIAKKMVEFLETHKLPAPKDKGFVDVHYPSGGKSVNVAISWQAGKQIYQLKTSQVPNEALGMVASVK